MQANPLITKTVRESCAAFTPSCVRIDEDALMKFAERVDLNEIDRFVHSGDGLATNRFEKDIPFPSMIDEAGFLVIAHGLDFGSGHRKLLHQHRSGAGAWLTIRAGLIAMGQENPRFEAKWLSSRTVPDVQRMFDLCRNEQASEDLLPLATQLHCSIQEFGHNLQRMGFNTPGDYLSARMNEGNFSSVALVNYFVHDFPITFNDEYIMGDQLVCLYKKAQLVASEIFMRFCDVKVQDCNNSADKLLCQQLQLLGRDIDELTAFVDNVVVAMLRLTGILVTSESLAQRIKEEHYLEKGSEEELGLRAKALQAMDLIVYYVNRSHPRDPPLLNAQRLCNWMWGGLGKLPQHRTFPRHLTPSTSFY